MLLVLIAMVITIITPGAVFAQDGVPLGEIIEAETLTAVNAEPEDRFAEDASGGAYVFLPRPQMEDAKPNSYIEVPIANMQGRYTIRVRAYAMSGGTDSLRYGFGGQWHSVGLQYDPSGWRWREISVYGYAGDTETVLIGAREPARIDAIEVIHMDSASVSPHQHVPMRPEPNAYTPIDINPPTFRWLKQGGASYRVQVARDARFEEIVLDEATNRTFLRPLQPLEPGGYHWRWRAETWDDGKWAAPERFEIDEEVARWPLPPWEESFARIPEGHPRIWMTPLRFEKMREWAATAEGQEAIDYWAGAMDGEIGKPLPLEQVKQKGEGLTREESVVQRVTFKSEAARTAGAMKNLAVLWALTGEERYAEEARRRALLIAGLDPRGYASHQVSDFGNGNLVEGMAWAYDYMQDYFSEDELATVRDAIHERLAITAPIFEGLEQRVYNAHAWQHTVLQFMAGALAIQSEVPEAREWFEWGVKATVALYPWFGGADGGSAEMASYFGGTNLRSSMQMRDLIFFSTGVDLLDNPWYATNSYYQVYSHPPRHMRSQFGDHAGGPQSPGPHATAYVVMRYRAALLQDPYVAAYAENLDGNPVSRVPLVDVFNCLTLPLPEPRSLAELPDARAFHDIGVAYLHTSMERPDDDIFFEFKSGPYGSYGHSHDDQNTFNLAAYNEPLLIDTGYYHSYGDAHHAGWTMQTKAHNGILVDGTGQPNSRLDAFGRLIAFEQGQEYMYCAGEAKWAYDQVSLDRFTRHVLAIKPDLFVIYDQIEAPEAHTYQYLLHAQQQMAVDEAAQSVAVMGERGQAIVTLLEPAGLSFSQHHQFDPPALRWRTDRPFEMPDQWHLTAETTDAASSARFLAVIDVGEAGGAPSNVEPLSGARWHGARVTREGSTVVVGFADELPGLDGAMPRVRMQLGGASANAFAAAVELRDGAVVRVITIGGDEAGVAGR